MVIEFPSYVEHIPNHFEEPVNTCFDAACSRNIYLNEELKTLVFKSEEGFYVAHLPGDRLLDMHKLAQLGFPGTFCPKHELMIRNLKKGCLNPFNVFELLHPIKAMFVCETILGIPRVYTNDGTLTGTISFPPSLLLSLFQSIVVVEISMEWTKRNLSQSRARVR
ncbi:MAG: hypothetical protein GXP18_08765 [Gammaproteobacteria bacterium]|nr:hypothetical protein [Gammaproteobacteria bacterium]